MDVEKTIQFIVEQQAQFSADIQVLKERDTVLSNQIKDLNQAQLRQLETVNRLIDVTSQLRTDAAERDVHWKDALAERDVHWKNALAERDARWEKERAELAADQRETSRSLKALIQVVDGLARRS